MKKTVYIFIASILSNNLVFGNNIKKINNSIYLAAQMTGLDYYEYNDQINNLDQQTGFLWGGRLGATASFNNIYFSVETYSTVGQTQFKGVIVELPNTYLNSNGTNVINNINAKLGYTLYLKDNFAITPYLELGYRFWNRIVEDQVFEGFLASGYREVYTTMYGSGGLLFQYSLSNSLVLGIFGSIGSTISPKVQSLSTNNTYYLGASNIYQAGVKLNYFITNHFSIVSGAEFMYFQYGESSTDSNGNFEPDSKTQQINAYIGLSYSF